MLRDPLIPPSEELLSEILGKSYGSYSELIRRYEESDYNLQPQWRYYNDGKAWLCKVKKTLSEFFLYESIQKVDSLVNSQNRRVDTEVIGIGSSPNFIAVEIVVSSPFFVCLFN